MVHYTALRQQPGMKRPAVVVIWSLSLAYGLGLTGGAPPWPKLTFNGLKSKALTIWSPVKSARSSYPGSPTPLPKLFFRMLKSSAVTTLSSLASPTRIVPISRVVIGTPVRGTVPALARYLGLLARQ